MRFTLLLKSLALLLIMSACNNLSTGQKSQILSVNDFEKKLSATKDAQLLDVRTPEEYAEKHLHDAVNINFNADDFIDKVDHLDKSKPVFVYKIVSVEIDIYSIVKVLFSILFWCAHI